MLYGGAEINDIFLTATSAAITVPRALVMGQVTTSASSTDIAAEVVIVSVVINICSAVQHL